MNTEELLLSHYLWYILLPLNFPHVGLEICNVYLPPRQSKGNLYKKYYRFWT